MIRIALYCILAAALLGCSAPSIDTPASGAKAITAFYFAAPVATGAINEGTHAIGLEVYGADLRVLTPMIIHKGASIDPASGEPRDFSHPVIYTVTAADGTTQTYTVTVTTSVRGRALQIFGESMVLPSEIPAKLTFDQVVTGSVSVRSTYRADTPGSIAYQEGSDYVVDYTNGTIARTATSRIPDFSTNVLYGQKDFDHKNFPGYTNHTYFVWVDYHTTNGERFAKPNDQSQYLTASRAKLAAGGTFRIISYGDSITAGGEASVADLRFTSLYAAHLETRFPDSTVLIEDVSLPGYTSTQAITSWDASIGKTSPDLVLVGLGMNDHNVGGSTPEEFKENLKTLVGRVKELHAEVILFSAFPPHDDWHYGTHRMNLYAEATREAAAESNCAYSDVFGTWAMVLQRKDHSSLLGNNINHPNDFGHWMYEQAFEAMIF